MTARLPLIDAKRLATLLPAGDICLLDASWHPGPIGRNARAEFEQAHIPSARFINLGQIADPQSELAHTLPLPGYLATWPLGHLAACTAAVGARRERRVVLYDNAGMAPSARAWWTLTTFGFNDVYVLDGGLRAWRDAGFAVEQGAPPPLQVAPKDLPLPDGRRLAGHQQVQHAIRVGHVVLDARSMARFHGEAAEPVVGICSGHIEGSTNLPYHQLLDAGTGGFAPDSVLRKRFERAGVDLRAPVVCSCGSGVTACVLALALETLGHPAVAGLRWIVDRLGKKNIARSNIVIYELKRYVAHEGKSEALQRRFAETTIPIFKRVGIDLVQCWTAPAEPGVLYYLVRFDDDRASERGWTAFGADAEWKAAKAASEKEGPLLAAQSTIRLTPASFSPTARG